MTATDHKLYVARIETHFYFLAPADASDVDALRRAQSLAREVISDSSPSDMIADVQPVEAGHAIEGPWDSRCLVYHDGADVTLGECLDAVPGHREAVEAFKARVAKARAKP